MYMFFCRHDLAAAVRTEIPDSLDSTRGRLYISRIRGDNPHRYRGNPTWGSREMVTVRKMLVWKAAAMWTLNQDSCKTIMCKDFVQARSEPPLREKAWKRFEARGPGKT